MRDDSVRVANEHRYTVLILLMRLNTRSLSALEAGIDSSCNDKYSIVASMQMPLVLYTLWLALTLMFVLHIYIKLIIAIGELATLEFTSCLNTILKLIKRNIRVPVCKIVISHIFQIFSHIALVLIFTY